MKGKEEKVKLRGGVGEGRGGTKKERSSSHPPKIKSSFPPVLFLPLSLSLQLSFFLRRVASGKKTLFLDIHPQKCNDRHSSAAYPSADGPRTSTAGSMTRPERKGRKPRGMRPVDRLRRESGSWLGALPNSRGITLVAVGWRIGVNAKRGSRQFGPFPSEGCLCTSGPRERASNVA